MHFQADKTIGVSINIYGEWAESEIYLISKYINVGETVLDIGANIGTHSLAFSRMVGRGGRVIAFDAQHKIFQVLGANMLLNNAFHVDCINALVGKDRAVTTIPVSNIVDNPNFGAASYRTHVSNQLAAPNGLPIAMITIDSLELKQCHFMKIDVEGMEIDVFRGAENTIKKFKPIIYFEQTTERSLKDIFAFFSERNYTLHWHVANPFNKNNYNKHMHNVFGGVCETNILALPKARPALRAIAGEHVVDMSKPDFDPVIPKDAIQGWSLPNDAYTALGRQTESSALLTDVVRGLQRELSDVKIKFSILAEDRQRAQEIMEHQHRELTRLSGVKTPDKPQ
jgi:FkbM family methyltransferase